MKEFIEATNYLGAKPEGKIMTDREKEVVRELNHPLYTVDFLEEWKDRDDNVFANAPAALQAMGANGFYEAVKRMVVNQENKQNITGREAVSRLFR